MVKILVLVIAVRILKQIRDNHQKKCYGCGSELDIEDFFLNNRCEYCGRSQGFDLEDFPKCDLNHCAVLENV